VSSSIEKGWVEELKNNKILVSSDVLDAAFLIAYPLRWVASAQLLH
jgi:hypothetical protein